MLDAGDHPKQAGRPQCQMASWNILQKQGQQVMERAAWIRVRSLNMPLLPKHQEES